MERDTRARIRELKDEVDPRWARERRWNYLAHEAVLLFAELLAFHKWYYEATQRNVPYLVRAILKEWMRYDDKMRKLKKLNRDFLYLWKRDGRRRDNITQEMIKRAREYPINRLLSVNGKGFALCPFHDDTHPSLYCKNNFAYCFACGWSGDCIAIVMEQDRLSFPEAVRKLQ